MAKKKPRPPEISPSAIQKFNTLAIGSDFLTIDELAEAAHAAGVFEKDDQDKAVRNWEKVQLRRLLKTQKDDTGWPKWHSIVVEDKNGEPVRAYGQEALFDLEQYKQVIDYHREQGLKHISTANELARRARKRLHLKAKQLPLPFPESMEGDK